MRRPQFHCKTHSEITDVMFELLSLIIIERGGEDKRTRGPGGAEAPGGKKAHHHNPQYVFLKCSNFVQKVDGIKSEYSSTAG